jgi:diaminopimelate epimerase
MPIYFTKYHGTGNDFVLIDNRQGLFDKNNTKLVAAMCERRFGIGADGLILLENHPDCDFAMVYYNSDGNASSMCGNGGRCIVHFAQSLGVVSTKAEFLAVDGMHTATISNTIVSLKMGNVTTVKQEAGYCFLDTGSPHHVCFVDQIDAIDVKKIGAKIRYEMYGKQGANVNFAQKIDNHNFKVRTYERGVEDETFSCGTGVTAVAIAAHASKQTSENNINLHTPGGILNVSFTKTDNMFLEVFLNGSAMAVYKGVWE